MFIEIQIKIQNFSLKNAVENVICKTVAILSRDRLVKHNK